MRKRNNLFFIGGVVVLLAVVGIGLSHDGELKRGTLLLGDMALRVEIAETPEQREMGLSHRKSLKMGRGMLFVFTHDDRHAMWMKDMQFPIDIVWIDASMTVVHIERMLTPETYPQVFSSPVPARYVLEVPAGYTDNRIDIADVLRLKKG